MMPTKNLHWLIKAQPAKRGGHKSHVRIAPYGVPGYMAALLETNNVGDGHNRRNGPVIWKPKNSLAKVTKTDGDSSALDPGCANPAVGPVHPDFVNVGFAAMEQVLDTLVSGTDDWAVPCEPESSIPWRDRSVLSERQLPLETWRGRHQPHLHIDIEPWAMYRMDQSGADFSRDSLMGALDILPSRGPPNNGCWNLNLRILSKTREMVLNAKRSLTGVWFRDTVTSQRRN